MALFVGNLSDSVRTRDIEELFERYGDCEIDVKKGYAFVDYEDSRDAEDALSRLHGKV